MLGYEPKQDTLILSKGADFTQIIRPDKGAFPVGTSATVLLVDGDDEDVILDEWSATVTATEAEWLVSSVLADEIPAASRFRIIVSYATEPESTEHCWYFGRVKRKQ